MPADLLEQNIKTSYIPQDMFPGAYIEPKWSLPDSIEQSKYYAAMLCLGARATEGVGDDGSYVSISFEGSEYVIHQENYKLCVKLADLLNSSYLYPKGYVTGKKVAEQLRLMPGVLIDCIRHLGTLASCQLKIQEGITKMLWIIPDEGPCGEYRSRKPAAYMNTAFKETFYTENSDVANTNVIPWYDVLIMHRIAAKPLFGAFQQAVTQGNKVMVLEYDDDFFTVPEWNHNSRKFGPNELSRFSKQVQIADVIVCSTQHLCDISMAPERTHHGPNLVDMNDFEGIGIGNRLECNRILQDRFVGYTVDVDKNSKKPYFKHRSKPRINNLEEFDYNPIRVLWTGSNTHDRDVEQLIQPIIKLGQEYGVAVQFVFFGYIPQQFVQVVTHQGNTRGRLQVTEEYDHYVKYIDPVPYGKYVNHLREIDADFALCPLYHHEFNLGKSNLKVLEMGALGIPCVATDYGPYRCIRHGVDGLLCKTGAANEWMDNIKKMIENHVYRKEMSKCIYQRVREEFSWNMDSENRRKWDSIFTVIKKKSDELNENFKDAVA